MYFTMENISSIVSKKSEKKFFLNLFLLPRVKMAQKSKFLGFLRNRARNVLHFEIHLPEKKFWSKKIILGVLERLENSKNTRKIDDIELRTRFWIFGGTSFE